MPSHDPTHCREQLATLMAEENALLAALEGLLAHEHGLLQSRDAEGLENAVTARQHCIARILHTEEERRALCRATGRGEDTAGLHGLLAWCDPTGLLVPAMQEYRERTLRCREQNDRNGKLVNSRLQGVAGILNALERSDGDGRTYGPGGGEIRGYGGKLTTRA
jgi:flagellar biosynthesis/type III secretory pathway chaperone